MAFELPPQDFLDLANTLADIIAPRWRKDGESRPKRSRWDQQTGSWVPEEWTSKNFDNWWMKRDRGLVRQLNIEWVQVFAVKTGEVNITVTIDAAKVSAPGNQNKTGSTANLLYHEIFDSFWAWAKASGNYGNMAGLNITIKDGDYK